MAKQSITVELDDATIRSLAVLGEPMEVLAQLAYAAAEGVRRPDHQRREVTDAMLRLERDKADTTVVDEEMADDVLPISRRRADEIVRTASLAGSALAQERATRKLERAASLAGEREATDKGLIGERAEADSVLVDQREANERMVSAIIRAHELTVEADAARKRAEKSERELREVAEFREMFIGILGHDLRTPLGSISMAAGLLLQRGHLDEEDAQTVARIIRASQRITRMVAQLLDLTRARLGGGLTIEPTPTDLREICRNVVEEFDAPIHLEVEGDVKGTWDQDRVAEVLSNLAGNAIEYAAPGTAVIVKARADGAEVVVEITNQGDPIPADQLPFIFEPFRRARRREKSKGGNLGLGLYIAHEIVLAHGGTLTAHSADSTTTFVMRLPRLAP
jgi:signal transduction histidine kinase